MITRRNLLSGMAAAGLMHGLPFAGPSAVAKAQDDWARLFKDALADNPLLLGWQGVGWRAVGEWCARYHRCVAEGSIRPLLSQWACDP